MITKDQALTAGRFTHVSKTQNKGKEPLQVRRTGKTQTWKTRPNDFKVPVKFGLYESAYITHLNAHEWNVADNI